MCVCMYVRPCHYKNSADWLMDVDRLVQYVSLNATIYIFVKGEACLLY